MSYSGLQKAYFSLYKQLKLTMTIKKICGNRGWHIVNIPPKYIKALGLNYTSYVELYMVDRLTLVMKKHNAKSSYGVAVAANKEPINV